MSQVMSDLEHTDALAAEYVLGTLDAGERAQARALLSTDQGFVTKVELWERRLGELHLMVEPVEPDAGIWVRIKAKIPDIQSKPSAQSAEPQMPTALSPVLDIPNAPQPAEPPSLDAIEARISETALALGATPPSSPMPTPSSDVTPALPLSDEVLPSISDTTPMPAVDAGAPMLDASPSPQDTAAEVSGDAAAASVREVAATATWETAAAPSVAEPESSPPVTPSVTPPAAPAAVPVQAADATPAAGSARDVVIVRRGLRRWRALAVLMMLAIAAMAALVAAWRFAPDRVPPMLQPVELMRHLNVTAPASAPPRRPIRTESPFEE